MAFRDTKKKPFIEDRDDNVFIGVELPFRRSDSKEGYFASTTTTIEAVKNNIKNLVQTAKGERFMQPELGLNLRNYMFEQVTDEIIINIQNDIVDIFKVWLPFVEIQDIQVSANETDAIGRNKLSVNIVFNITKDPTSLESVQVEITGE